MTCFKLYPSSIVKRTELISSVYYEINKSIENTIDVSIIYILCLF